MIQKQYDNLRNQTISITASLLNLLEDLDKTMDCKSKDFTVKYKNKTYELYQPTDIKESREQKLLRRKLAIALTERCIKIFFKQIKNKKENMDFCRTWDDILCFAMGADPIDHQFEKFEVEDVYEVNDGTDAVRGVSLNMDSYAVKNDLGFLDGN
jgi:hypothetical protein